MYKHLIGKQSEKVENQVERGAVAAFARSIGDPHPLYVDKEYGKYSKYQNNIAPPTFPRTFSYGTIPGLHLPVAGLIHGEQTFEYKRPLLIGEEIYCHSKVENYREKRAASGHLGFLTLINIGEDMRENNIFTSKVVLVLTEQAREGEDYYDSNHRA
ncbi:MaoC family dehydratase N-terminal domain-containing protein [Alteribacillus sp. YIM 98480]|uniref:MaoC family dehydratase N-terminal domain-containing protein n=1 Tax=Alteribacillus sp. YIM 98480 TaxID=2606599 RepID=UPI00131D9F44|nr:MaoC family dehydratase N-terminal domain-containing protein [Alteribacillus sp. YIM 98480]